MPVSSAAHSSSLAPTREDLRAAGDDGPNVWWIPMLPVFLPSELLEPHEALFKARQIQDRSDVLDVHLDLDPHTLPNPETSRKGASASPDPRLGRAQHP